MATESKKAKLVTNDYPHLLRVIESSHLVKSVREPLLMAVEGLYRRHPKQAGLVIDTAVLLLVRCESMDGFVTEAGRLKPISLMDAIPFEWTMASSISIFLASETPAKGLERLDKLLKTKFDGAKIGWMLEIGGSDYDYNVSDMLAAIDWGLLECDYKKLSRQFTLKGEKTICRII